MLNGSPARTPVAFLQALHAGCTGVTELRAMRPSNGSRPDCAFLLHDDLDGFSRFTARHKDSHVYLAVATRRDHTSGRLDNCAQLSTLFIDIDFKLTPEEDARRRLEEFPLPPSAVVLSGGGLHVYWLLHEPLNLQLSDERTLAYTLLRRLAQHFAADAQAAEPARVLRMPGTFNIKYDPPRFVQLDHLAEELRYHPCEFDTLLPAEPLTEHSPSFVAPETIGDGERNGTLFKEARSLKAKNFSRDAIREAIRAENRVKCAPPLPDTEIEDIVESAWTQADRPEFQQNGSAPSPLTDEELVITESAGLHAVRCAKYAVTMTFDRLTSQRGTLYAELTVTFGATVLLDVDSINLKSDAAHGKLASSLKALTATAPWKALIPRACAMVLRRHRSGEPIKHLSRYSHAEPLSYTLTPIIERSAGNIVFGDGGLGKSSLGLLWALQILSGESVAGFLATRGKPLFLDYEDTDQTLIRRIQAIAAAHPRLGEEPLSYQECSEPIWQIAHQLQRRIYEEQFTCVVLDSLLPATGGDSGAEATTKAFNAIRKLKTEDGRNIDSLICAHVAKGNADAAQRQTVYGSVFSQNYARNIWELKRESEVGSDTSILGLFHHKANHGPKLHPIGLQVVQNRTSTFLKYEPFDLSKTAELVNALPLPNRIRKLLESDGVPRFAKDIADELQAPLATVKVTLSNHKGRKWSLVGENRDAKWTTLNR